MKIRVWDTKRKKFTEGYEDNNNYEELYSDPPGLLFGALNYLKKYEEYYTLQQFTGLKDKNGREIYEGDIIFLDSHDGLKGPWVIAWHNVGFAMHNKTHTDKNPHWALFNQYEYSGGIVIKGNIFENPELLK